MKVFDTNGRELPFEYRDAFPWYDPTADPRHPKMAHNCDAGWYKITAKNIYRIFFDDVLGHVWIGRLNIQADLSANWYNVTKDLKVDSIDIVTAIIKFN